MVQWIGILICILHSAMFSGLNLGFFGLSRLRLEVQADTSDPDAIRILYLRKHGHLLLSTLLWGNVASNVLLTLLTDSMMTGVAAFMFSTFGITLFGEIFPQAYLARHALRYSTLLVPVVRFYQVILYPMAGPTGWLLDIWLGKEEISYFKEKEFIAMLKRHGQSGLSDLANLESLGAMNFLTMDDIHLEQEGEILNPQSIIQLEQTESGLLIFPNFERRPDDSFLQKVHASGEKWVVFTNPQKEPMLAIKADEFLREVMYSKEVRGMMTYCHRPIVIKDKATKLGDVIHQFKVRAESAEDDVVDNDLILYWGKQKRIITGADILGRLLRGIVQRAVMNEDIL